MGLLVRMPNMPPRGRTTVLAVLGVHLLVAAHAGADVWPADLATSYVDDLLQDRIWVDTEEAKPIVQSLQAAIFCPPPPPPPGSILDSERASREPAVSASAPDMSSIAPRLPSPRQSDAIVPPPNTHPTAPADFHMCPRIQFSEDVVLATQQRIINGITRFLAERGAQAEAPTTMRVLLAAASLPAARGLIARHLPVCLRSFGG